MVMRYLMVGLGGSCGAMARFWLGGEISQRMGARFPCGSFAVNISGCYFLGLILAVLTENGYWSAGWRYLVAVGFIGAYTTFSAFEWETFQSVQNGQFVIAGLNVGLSVFVGFLALWLGVVSGRALA
jgi:CrcB protein